MHIMVVQIKHMIKNNKKWNKKLEVVERLDEILFEKKMIGYTYKSTHNFCFFFKWEITKRAYMVAWC